VRTVAFMSLRNAEPVRDVPPHLSTPAAAADLKIARTIVTLLDKYQLDPIIGLLAPGVGDIITTLIGGYLVSIAARRKVPPIVIARMLLNLGVDAAVGIIPLVGDVADFGIRANKKNLELMEARHERQAHWKDWLAVGGAAILVLGMFGLAIYGFIRLLGAIF